MVGQGADGATDELEQIADTLAAPIVKALLGKAVVPDDSPYTHRRPRPAGNAARRRRRWRSATASCSSAPNFPYMNYLPKPGQAKAVQIDRDPTRLGLRYPIDIGLTGDAPATLKRCFPCSSADSDRSFLETGPGADDGVEGADEEPRDRDDVPLKPQVVAAARQRPACRTDAIVTTDSGTITTWAARHIHMNAGHAVLVLGQPGDDGTGPALRQRGPGGVPRPPGRRLRRRRRLHDARCCEFITAVKHNLPIKVIVIKNNVLGQIKWEQMVFLGNPEYGVELHPIDFVKFAEACGGVGFRCETPDEVRPGPAGGVRVQEARRSSRRSSTRSSRRCPRRRRPSRVSSWPSRSPAASRTRGKIATTLFRDKVDELL